MLPYLIDIEGNFSSPRMINTQRLKKDYHFKLHSYFHSLSFLKQEKLDSFEDMRLLF